MTNVLVTPERAAFLRQRLKEKFAELQAAKANFSAVCERLGTEPRSKFGEFAQSFEEIGLDWSVPLLTRACRSGSSAQANVERPFLSF
ncbi:hypothetical protein [Methylocystis parvus]|uniref:Uncharacterized protein n=1 Tax=Methylocystis parvus TaxID=134 RepID=A0A6B8M6K1_9HYPH|nr:hypothetical protein [Methylocystis parvus]QGM97702.1 hypothetical protein F7D14_09635 [Methylocystis parvus]WBJ98363.1 hypothetical protein MMG94_09955 [Methylocystis parvus OBBP]